MSHTRVSARGSMLALLAALIATLTVSAASLAEPWFGDPVVTQDPRWAYDLVTGDLNRDGLSDLIVSTGTASPPQLRVFLMQPSGAMTLVDSLPMTTGGQSCIVLVDDNRDSFLDVIAGTVSGSFAMWHNDGTGHFYGPFTRTSPHAPFAIATSMRMVWMILLGMQTRGSWLVSLVVPAGLNGPRTRMCN
jgi:hypothetical protein